MKNNDLFLKNLTFEFQTKQMPFKLFEFQEQFTIDTFLIKLTQFEITGSISKFFIPLGNLKITFHFRN